MQPRKLLIPLILLVVGLGEPGFAQSNPRNQPAPVDTLAGLSESIEALATRVHPCIAQVIVSGFGTEPAGDAVLVRQNSTGSAVILTPDGYLLTNAHVVEGARRIQIQLAGEIDGQAPGKSIVKPRGRTVEAKLVGQDRETDLAILKIEEKGLPFLDLADSDTVRQGQIVMAFGSPLGLDNTLTLGVVSAVARQLETDAPVVYIQTDAPINPGNSGGALVDVRGRLVGINTLIFTQSGGSQGIGFAIPSNIARSVFDQIRKNGSVVRGTIGVFGQTITPPMAAALGLPQAWGVLLSDVFPNGSGYAAGLVVGDIVTKLDGKPMENARQFDVNVYRHGEGETIVLDVLRDGRPLTLKVSVVERFDDARIKEKITEEKNLIRKLGVYCADISPELAALFPLRRQSGGILIVAKYVGAPPRLPFQAGDIVYSINRTPIENVAELRLVMSRLKPTDTIVAQVERNGRLMYLTIDLE